jgi:hypothetical protein
MRIPTYQRRQTPVKVMPQVTNVDISGFGEALTKTGAFFGQKLRENREMVQLAKAQTDTASAFAEFRLDLEKDPDYLKYPEKYNKFIKPTAETIANNITEPNAKQSFQMWVDKEQVQQKSQVDWLSHNKEVKDLTVQLDTLVNKAVELGRYDLVEGYINAATYGETPLILPNVGKAKIEWAKNQIAYNNAFSQAMKMPYEEAEPWARNPENNPDITAKQRDQLVSEIRQERGFQKMLEQEKWDAKNREVEKAFVDKFYVTQNLSYKDVEKGRDAVTEGEYEHWMSMLRRRDDERLSGSSTRKSDESAKDWLYQILYSGREARWMSPEEKQIEIDKMRLGESEHGYLNQTDAVKGVGDINDVNVIKDTYFYNGTEIINTAFESSLNQIDEKLKIEKDKKKRDKLIDQRTEIMQSKIQAQDDFRELYSNSPNMKYNQNEILQGARNIVTDTKKRNKGWLTSGSETGPFGVTPINFIQKLEETGGLIGVGEKYHEAFKEAETYIEKEFEKTIDNELKYKYLPEVKSNVDKKFEAMGVGIPAWIKKIDVQKSMETEKLKEEKENLDIRTFEYPTGEQGRLLLDKKRGDVSAYIFRNGKWEMGYDPRAIQSKASQFLDIYGKAEDTMYNTNTGEFIYKSGGLWYGYDEKKKKWVAYE